MHTNRRSRVGQKKIEVARLNRLRSLSPSAELADLHPARNAGLVCVRWRGARWPERGNPRRGTATATANRCALSQTLARAGTCVTQCTNPGMAARTGIARARMRGFIQATPTRPWTKMHEMPQEAGPGPPGASGDPVYDVLVSGMRLGSARTN